MRQYNTSMQSDSEIARAKLFRHEITMAHFPNYYAYELAFASVIQDCDDLSMLDQLAWLFMGMTPELHIAVCKQPVTNQPWHTLEAAQAYTRGHILRYPTVLKTPATLLHSATPAQIMQSTAEIDAARRPQAHQGPAKVPRHSGPGRDDGSSGWQVAGGGGRERGRGKEKNLAPTAAVQPPFLARVPAAAGVDKKTASYIL